MTDSITRTEMLVPGPAEGLAGLLDIDMPSRDLLPELWHWVYLLDRRRENDLGPDGHPSSGIPAPPGEGRRRMWAGGRVETHRLLSLDEPATRTTKIASSTEKQGRTGPLTFVTVRSEIEQGGSIAIVDEQDIVYRAPGQGSLPQAEEAETPSREARLDLAVDERFLFRFSALTYNAHRIHYDHAWARHEGYDDLVVHGPLQALMMSELVRREGGGLVGRRFSYRLVSPMVGPQTLSVLAAEEGLSSGAEVRSARGVVTARSNVEGLAT